MAITSCPFMKYNKGVKHIAPEQMLSDDIRIILTTSSYVPDVVNDEYYDVDITDELPTANGYTVGGVALTTKSLTESATPGVFIFSSDNPYWDVVTASL